MDTINGAFTELQKHIREQGLLTPSPAFYIYRITMALMLIAISMLILATITNFWVQMANAIFLAFAFGQLSFLMHDVGHGQVTGNRWHGLMTIFFDIVLGFNPDWWIHKHNKHHAFPNQPGYDPDIDIKFLAFSKDQALEKSGVYRITARHQDILFIPLLLGEAWSLRSMSMLYLFKQGTWHAAMHIFFIALHNFLFIAILLFFLPLWHALVFALVTWGLLGVYVGLTFAPNHKGMPIIDHGTVLGFLEQQVRTSRNVRGNVLIDFLYGGLNYQIEHHLFPSMPRNRLKKTAVIVESFCTSHGIVYTSIGVKKSFYEIFRHLSCMGKSVS